MCVRAVRSGIMQAPRFVVVVVVSDGVLAELFREKSIDRWF